MTRSRKRSKGGWWCIWWKKQMLMKFSWKPEMRRGCEFSFPIHKEIREVDDEQMLCNVNVGDRLIVPVREVTWSYTSHSLLAECLWWISKQTWYTRRSLTGSQFLKVGVWILKNNRKEVTLSSYVCYSQSSECRQYYFRAFCSHFHSSSVLHVRFIKGKLAWN